jgi:cytosine/creatinine deaminase
MDLIFRRVNLPDGRTRFDVGIEGDHIAAVEQELRATAHQEIDGTDRLLSPSFVDAHFHLDATLSLGLPRMNRSGTLLEGIALWAN